jgi:hypothetical protein
MNDDGRRDSRVSRTRSVRRCIAAASPFATSGPLIFSRSGLVRATDAVVATIDASISRQKARCYSVCAVSMHSVPHTLVRDLPSYAACFLANAATSACVANQQSPFALA